MIFKLSFFPLSLGIGCWLLVVGCRLWVVGSIVQSNPQPTTHNPQPTTKIMLSNEVTALFCAVFNGC